MIRRLCTTLTSLVIGVALIITATARAAESDPVPPAALPASFLPLVTGSGSAFDLSISGIEVTQGTQTSSNSVPLVAGRATVARIYAVADRDEPVNNVVVTLSASRNGVTLAGSPLRVGPKQVTRTASRGIYSASFNAALPQAWLSGQVQLVATVDADRTAAESNEGNNTSSASLGFGAVPALDVKIVPVRYTHTPTGRVYPAPTRDTISDWVLRSFPVSQVRISFRAPIDYVGDLTDSAAWGDLLDQVTDAKLADGAPSHQVYYALTPTSSGADRWFYGGVAGIGWVGMRAAVSLEFGAGQEDKTGRIAAHEIGHNLRRYHAPCGTAGDARQPYPYTNGSIGPDVYGLDISQGRVWSPVSPDSAKDVMSYCTPQWMSDFTYTGLYVEQRATGGAVASEPGDGLLVRAELDGGGGATLLPVYALSDVAPAADAGAEYAVELLDAAGALLASHPVQVAEAHAPHGFEDTLAPGEAHEDHAAGPLRISAVLPLPAGDVAAVRLVRLPQTTALALMRQQPPQLVAERALAPAQLTEAAEKSAATGGALALRWAPADAPALVRYSADGERWVTLGVDVRGGELLVDLAALPGGGAGRFVVTAEGAAPLTLTTPKAAAVDAPPSAWISGPARVAAGEPAVVYGRAADREDGAIDVLGWTIDGIPVEGGQALPVGALAPGSHQIALTARDSAGQSVTAVHRLVIYSLPAGG